MIDSAPEPMLFAHDADHDLIQVPLVSNSWKTTMDLVSKALTELQEPLPDGLMADQDAGGGQHLLDHAQAERKSEIQPDGIADHFSRKAVAGTAGMTGLLHPSATPALGAENDESNPRERVRIIVRELRISPFIGMSARKAGSYQNLN